MKDDERVQGRGNEQRKKYEERDVGDDSLDDDGGVSLPGRPSSQVLNPQLNQGIKDSDIPLDSLITKTQTKKVLEGDNSAKNSFEKNASPLVLAEGLPLYINNINPARQNLSVFPFQSTSSSQLPPIQSTYPNPTSQTQHHGHQKNYDFKSLRKGTRDEWGDMAYYDSSFVEDPWKGLWVG